MMTFAKYETDKNSDLERISDGLERWDDGRLKDWVKSVVGGGTPSTTKNEYWNGNIPWVSPKDMKADFIEKTEDYITDLAVTESTTNLISPERVLIVTRSGILRRILPVAINKVEVTLNQDIKALESNSKLLPHFLFWKLQGQSSDILATCNKIGATVESIEMGDLLNFPFAVPPVEEQTAIVKYLKEETTHIDKKIDLLQTKIIKYRELRKTIVNEAVTKGLDKTVELKDSHVEWLGKIPIHWSVIRSKSLFEQVSIKNHSDKKLLSIYRDYGVIEKTSRDDNHNRASDDLSNYKFVKKGYLVINKMKAWQGSVAISNLEGIVSPAYITCKPLRKGHNFYFHYLLRSTSCITEFQRYSYGVRPEQWDLRYTDFADFMLTVPPLAEQIAIANYLDEKTSKIDSIIAKIDENIVALNEFRKTLIKDAVTGRIKIV